MQATKLSVWNMALGFIGTRTVASANERTPEAIQCELYWDTARRSALRDFPYRFAQRRFFLTEKPLPAAYAGEWQYCYGVPDGCLKVHMVRDSSGSEVLWWLVGDGDGPLLLTTAAQAQADCTCDVENVALWDELFVLAMARKLAALIAVPLLKNNSTKMQELVQLYQQAIPSAEGQDASEGLEQQNIDPWLQAREAW